MQLVVAKVKMNKQQTKYELLKENSSYKQRCIYFQICVLLALCVVCSVAVYSTWTAIYQSKINIPPKLIDIPHDWIIRANKYANATSNASVSNKIVVRFASQIENASLPTQHSGAVNRTSSVIKIENETIYPSRLGNFIYSTDRQTSASSPRNQTEQQHKLICYYAAPAALNHPNELYPDRIDPYLCTHINVGNVYIENNQLVIDDALKEAFKQMTNLKRTNGKLKVLIWVGGADPTGFEEMVKNHANRKEFIRSLKSTLETYRLDGVDLDWEFPATHDRQKLHFAQLLHEIRREYEREHRTYLLSVAVAAPEGIIFYAYYIGEINQYCDYVNVMTYDYHFYSPASPFTGLNAPLYQRHDEHSLFATLNINASVSYWHENGLDKSKIIIGLPTYGHSFRLVNPLNTKLGSPANGYGRVGQYGFVTYSDVCWFERNNFFVTKVFDSETCSPYVYAGTEWISFENEQSIACKTKFVKENSYGGVMIFSLNTDDYSSYCYYGRDRADRSEFPLTRKINSILFDNH